MRRLLATATLVALVSVVMLQEEVTQAVPDPDPVGFVQPANKKINGNSRMTCGLHGVCEPRNETPGDALDWGSYVLATSKIGTL